MRNVRRRVMTWMAVAGGISAGAAVALAAAPTQIQILTDQGLCNATLQVTSCQTGPTATPRPGDPTPTPTQTPDTPVPTPTPGTVGGCPVDALDLNHVFERQQTLLGYDRIRTSGLSKFKFCARPAKASTRGGNLGAAWQDSGTACTQIRVRLVSFNGTPVAGGSTNWSGTPQLTYKFLFGSSAPVGEYYFEIDADSSGCANGQGSFMVIWTP